MDSIEQMSEQIDRVTTGHAPGNTIADYGFVVYIGGRWHPGTFTGRVSACIEHIETTLKVDLSDRSVRWARGHVADNGSFVIHPANDRDAVYTLEQLLKSRQRRR